MHKNCNMFNFCQNLTKISPHGDLNYLFYVCIFSCFEFVCDLSY